MRKNRLAVVAASVALVATSATACRSSKSTGGSTGGGSNARGPITFVQGKDNGDLLAPMVAAWNAAHPTEKVTFKEQTDQADQQHDDLVQHFQAKSTDLRRRHRRRRLDRRVRCQGLAARRSRTAWPWTPTGFLPAHGQRGHLQQHPVRRADVLRRWPALLPQGPRAQAAGDVRRAAGRLPDREASKGIGCYAGQFAKYEGLTVQRRRGDEHRRRQDGRGRRQDPDRRHPAGQTPACSPWSTATRTATSRSRPSPSRRSRAARRSRPASCCSCATGRTSTTWARPTRPRRSRASSPSLRCRASPAPARRRLGGHNGAISAYSKHKATALDFLKFLESER